MTGAAARRAAIARRCAPWNTGRMADDTLTAQQIQIQVDPHQGTGVYSNLMMISHRQEEFILDFLFL